MRRFLDPLAPEPATALVIPNGKRDNRLTRFLIPAVVVSMSAFTARELDHCWCVHPGGGLRDRARFAHDRNNVRVARSRP
jgi:hypothetical protein